MRRPYTIRGGISAFITSLLADTIFNADAGNHGVRATWYDNDSGFFTPVLSGHISTLIIRVVEGQRHSYNPKLVSVNENDQMSASQYQIADGVIFTFFGSKTRCCTFGQTHRMVNHFPTSHGKGVTMDDKDQKHRGKEEVRFCGAMNHAISGWLGDFFGGMKNYLQLCEESS